MVLIGNNIFLGVVHFRVAHHLCFVYHPCFDTFNGKSEESDPTNTAANMLADGLVDTLPTRQSTRWWDQILYLYPFNNAMVCVCKMLYPLFTIIIWNK